jgi:hypothetical protein
MDEKEELDTSTESIDEIRSKRQRLFLNEDLLKILIEEFGDEEKDPKVRTHDHESCNFTSICVSLRCSSRQIQLPSKEIVYIKQLCTTLAVHQDQHPPNII